jgi:hypothetical protein
MTATRGGLRQKDFPQRRVAVPLEAGSRGIGKKQQNISHFSVINAVFLRDGR